MELDYLQKGEELYSGYEKYVNVKKLIVRFFSSDLPPSAEFYNNFPKLEHLVIHGRLQNVPKDSFLYLPNLLILDLSDNKIVNFQNGAFNGLKNLRKLIISGNIRQWIRRTDVGISPDVEVNGYAYP